MLQSKEFATEYLGPNRDMPRMGMMEQVRSQETIATMAKQKVPPSIPRYGLTSDVQNYTEVLDDEVVIRGSM